MQFLKVTGIVEKPEGEQTPDLQDKGVRNEIASASLQFNDGLDGKAYVALAESARERCKLIVLLRDEAPDAEQLIGDYLSAIRLRLSSLTTEEITFEQAKNLLASASRRDFMEDDRGDILERFGLDGLWRFPYVEYLLESTEKEAQYQAASRVLSEKTLIPELDRIYQGSTGGAVKGNPVHYLLRCDDRDVLDEMTEVLLQALWNQKRIRNRRFAVIASDSAEDLTPKGLRLLFESFRGGAVAVGFRPTNEDEGSFASADREIIRKLCTVIREYRDRVLTLICLPRECTKTRARFLEMLGNVSLVEILEDPAAGKRAREYLKAKAAADGFEPDRKLFAKLKKGETHLSSELNRFYDDWRCDKLRRTFYPQYRQFTPSVSVAVKQKPEGDAVAELDEMIGLASAKKVIGEALSYYKAQRLYAEKGLRLDRAAMHMVFTGNPGTAKTTTARLFARIMRDNGLLSKGQLVEVGRGDLVGKYVGWTAPTVKKKFQEAQGGVLFIDEAYSLVDDRDGLYGDEAINTIVQEMENHRDDMVVIFAGYPDKMAAFLEKNPGLRSRIAFHVPFEDYSAEDLCRITRLHAEKKQLTLTDEALEKLDGIYREVLAQKDFGNGRFVRNMLEKAQMAQASRLLKMDPETVTEKDVRTIEAADIEPPVFGTKAPEKRAIGF